MTLTGSRLERAPFVTEHPAVEGLVIVIWVIITAITGSIIVQKIAWVERVDAELRRHVFNLINQQSEGGNIATLSRSHRKHSEVARFEEMPFELPAGLCVGVLKDGPGKGDTSWVTAGPSQCRLLVELRIVIRVSVIDQGAFLE